MGEQINPKVQAARDAEAAAAKRMDALEAYIPTIIHNIGRVWPKVAGAFDEGRFVASTVQALQRQPRLIGQDADAWSLLGALRQCAEYGLYPDVERGHVSLTPRWNKDTMMWRTAFMVGYKGLVYLFRRNPISADGNPVQSERVFEDEVQDLIYVKGLEPRLEYHPNLVAKEGERKLALVFTILRYRDGSFDFDHVLGWQIEQIRANHSDAKDSSFSPWNSKTDLVRGWMEKKTSMKQVLKLSPALDDVMASAVALDDLADVGVDQRLVGRLDKTLREIGGKLLTEGQAKVTVPAASSVQGEKTNGAVKNGSVAGNSLKNLMEARKAAQEPTKPEPEPKEAEAPANEPQEAAQEAKPEPEKKAPPKGKGKSEKKKSTAKASKGASEGNSPENAEGLPFEPDPEKAYDAMMADDGAV